MRRRVLQRVHEGPPGQRDSRPDQPLKPGDKVLATNVKTGKTSAEPVTAVLVHHDTDLYDLTVATGARISVIHTTSNHLFWDQTIGRWVKAAAFLRGDNFRSPTGAIATAAGSYWPNVASGWMWDLTVPRDHDFYVTAGATALLVHNCPVGPDEGANPAENPDLGSLMAARQIRQPGMTGSNAYGT
jgi:Pretoxin HINT domain